MARGFAGRALVVIVATCLMTGNRGSASAAEDAGVTTVYVNANIHTVDAAIGRAGAMAVREGRFLEVGSEAEVRRAAGEGAKVVDLAGMTVLPGLIDAHGHMAGLGAFARGRTDLSFARSYQDVVRATSESADRLEPGEWVLGGRWDHESWASKQLPAHDDLSRALPENPVWLTRVDGHAGLANAEAMQRAGVTSETPDPPGGAILRDEEGEPTGVFIDNAMSLIERAIDAPLPRSEDLLLAAQEMCLSAGLTGVHDAGVSPAEIAAYRRLAERGNLKLRVYAMVSAPYAIEHFSNRGITVGERLTVRSVKMYMDGAMGSRGAWLLEPYSDRPTDERGRPYTGLALSDPEFVRDVCEHALEVGYQVCTHAIGDRANREVLDAYAEALKRRPTEDHRFRIEHAQLLATGDIPRFARLGVIPSMQPTHCTSDMRWVEDRVGPERARGAYAWASLIRAGVPIAGGSDFPVESHNPFLGLHAAVTRQNLGGDPPGGWRPEERMTRDEALRSFTIWAARASFEEDVKGSITPGKMADFIVIDRDVMTCDAQDIPETRVLRTVIGGETVFVSGD